MCYGINSWWLDSENKIIILIGELEQKFRRARVDWINPIKVWTWTAAVSGVIFDILCRVQDNTKSFNSRLSMFQSSTVRLSESLQLVPYTWGWICDALRLNVLSDSSGDCTTPSQTRRICLPSKLVVLHFEHDREFTKDIYRLWQKRDVNMCT